ncbi:Trp biosynthesis-associated membrane protein [Nocardioides houyundeii]|uniref:Trp biosynthesis-associated membrane protein n=1 Tax=Nocardioides houyundeii TaxID=2045452 RepID=UPI000DF1DC92|nr:Trp biosynthesis-associated membrane protein [Nocardioides houyundeii]
MAERSFGPTVLLGVGTGVLAAVSGSRAWMSVEPADPETPGAALVLDGFPGLGQMPLAGALGLVVLACWGVVLVSRGLMRRVVAWLGLVVALGLVATWITGLVTLREAVLQTLEEGGAGGEWNTAWTSWFWVAAVAALGCVAAAVVAGLRAGRWPAMGSRYDAPTGGGPASVPGRAEDGGRGEDAEGETDPAALWKALDEGRDPTRDGAP